MAKVFADAGKIITDGLKQYVKEVMDGDFPQPENWFSMSDEELDQLTKLIE
jgi:ketopantoate hydroxymethyltransferase